MQDRSKRLRACVLGAALVAAAGAAIAQPDNGIVIVNGTRTAMIMLHIKDSRAAAWQTELLGRKPLGVQKEASYRRDRGACVYDLKAMFEDGHRVTKQRVDLCKSPRYVLADF
jgi:hypothetical protein